MAPFSDDHGNIWCDYQWNVVFTHQTPAVLAGIPLPPFSPGLPAAAALVGRREIAAPPREMRPSSPALPALPPVTDVHTAPGTGKQKALLMIST